MKKINLNKKNGIILFLLIVGIGTTLAFFTSTVSIPNIFTSLKYETTTTTEDFTSPSNWKPGDETPKTVITTNDSNVPIRVRISVEESWTDKNNNSLPLSENNTLAAIINLDNRQDWIYDNGYYYYKYDVEPGDATNSFIKSVTFNKDIVGEYVCTTSSNSEQCDSASDTYQDATYNLNVSVETTPADNYLESWGLDHVPRRVAPTYCTYDSELVQGAEYVNGQYTYRYMQERSSSSWDNIDTQGWGVSLTNKELTDPVTTSLCTYINDVPVVSYKSMFAGAMTTSVDTSSFDTSNVKNMRGMIANSKITNMDFSNFETENVTDMAGMFQNSLLSYIDLSSFDTSNVTNMYVMFTNCSNLEQIIGIEDFDVSNVTEMRGIFQLCKFKSLDLSKWDVSNVGNMQGLFTNCVNLEEINLSNWNITSSTSLRGMFANCSSLRQVDLSSFDTSNVTDMNSMFLGCSYLNTIYVSNKWSNNSVTNSADMFNGCISLPGYDSTKIDASMANTNGGYFTLKP